MHYKGGHCGICQHPGWLSPFFFSSCIHHLFMISGLAMSILPSMALIPYLKPSKDSFFTLSMNLRTPFQSAPKQPYDMSLFQSSAMLWMIFKIIYSIFLLNPSVFPLILQISFKIYKQVTLGLSTSVVAAGLPSHTLLLHAESLTATFGIVFSNQPSQSSSLTRTRMTPTFHLAQCIIGQVICIYIHFTFSYR